MAAMHPQPGTRARGQTRPLKAPKAAATRTEASAAADRTQLRRGRAAPTKSFSAVLSRTSLDSAPSNRATSAQRVSDEGLRPGCGEATGAGCTRGAEGPWRTRSVAYVWMAPPLPETHPRILNLQKVKAAVSGHASAGLARARWPAASSPTTRSIQQSLIGQQRRHGMRHVKAISTTPNQPVESTGALLPGLSSAESRW